MPEVPVPLYQEDTFKDVPSHAVLVFHWPERCLMAPWARQAGEPVNQRDYNDKEEETRGAEQWGLLLLLFIPQSK